MTKKKSANTNILGRAMLVNLTITGWTARKLDRDVTNKTNADYSASPDACRVNKQLFAGQRQYHQDLISGCAHARAIFYQQTLPYSDSGWRLLPMLNYFEFTEAIRAELEKLEDLLNTFCTHYGAMRRAAPEFLKGMFNEDDYPPVDVVRGRFKFKIDYAPLPAGDDFRVTLPAEELERVKQDVTDRITQATDVAVRECWTRLGDAVNVVNNRLQDDGRHLRETMIERLKSVADALERFNVTEDPTLDKMRVRVKKELTTIPAELLRDDERTRVETAKKAAAILATMSGLGMYEPPKEEA